MPGKDETENAEVQGRESVFKPLPDWKRVKKPFDRISELDVDTEAKDKVILWWKENPRTIGKLAELENVVGSASLPKNDSRFIDGVFKQAQETFNAANGATETLIKTTQAETHGGVARRIIMFYKKAYGLSPAKDQLLTATEAIGTYKEGEDLYRLAGAVGRALIDTRARNPKDEMYYEKAAQSFFDEMIQGLSTARTSIVHDIDIELSPIIDSPLEEKLDLTSTFMGEPWTGDERRGKLRDYEKLKRILDKVGADTDTKIGLNTLWNWANGQTSKDSSIFKIIEYADALDRNVTNELGPIWRAERDRLEE